MILIDYKDRRPIYEQVVEKMADKVLVLKNGKVREYGKTAQVLTAPEDPYTKELMSSVLRLKRTGTGNGGR